MRKSTSRLPRAFDQIASRRLLNGVLALAAMLLVVFEAGLVTRTETLVGPFVQERPTGRMLVTKPTSLGILHARGNDAQNWGQSTLRLWVNDREYSYPHTYHDRIREGEPDAFDHWKDSVRFSLPPEIPNSAATTVRMDYPVYVCSRFVSRFVLALLIGLWLRLNWHTRPLEEFVAIPARAAILLLYAIGGMAGLYAASVAVASLAGASLPAASLFKVGSLLEGLSVYQYHSVQLLMVLVVLAGGGSIVASSLGRPAKEALVLEERVQQLLYRWGLPILFAFMMFSVGAQWAGISRVFDFHDNAIVGLIPFNDSGGYFGDMHQLAASGRWGDMSARRPMAAAARSALMTSAGHSYSAMIAVQNLVLAGAIWFAAIQIARWLGAWAAILVVCFLFLIARSFLTVTLTEPIGLAIAIVSVPFFISSILTGSKTNALLGVALFVGSLFVRMGSMFTIPALVAWTAWCFGSDAYRRMHSCAVAAAVVMAVLGLNFVLSQNFSANPTLVGSNFSYTICGLTIGEGWKVCEQRYAAEVPEPRTEKALADKMYAKAWDNFSAQPSLFIKRIGEGAARTVAAIYDVLVSGYRAGPEPLWFWGRLLMLVLTMLAIRRLIFASPRERWFWAAIWCSTIASGAFVIFDDGRRVLIASYPLLALFFALGIATRGTLAVAESDRKAARLAKVGVVGVPLLGAILIAAPTASYLLSRRTLPAFMASANTQEHIVWGGRYMTGIRVVPDDQDIRSWRSTDIPMTSFVRAIYNSGMELRGLVARGTPSTPFGFVSMPRAERGKVLTGLYVVPPDVLAQPDVSLWRFTVMMSQETPGLGLYWFHVTKAEPLSSPKER